MVNTTERVNDLKEINDCRNFSEVIYYQARRHPDRVFIYDLRTMRTYTFYEFNRVVERTANYLAARGVKPGDRVTVVVENSPEYCFLYFSVIRVGAMMNPMPFMSHREEILKNIQLVEPQLVFLDERKRREFEDETPEQFIYIPVDAASTFEKNLGNMPDRFSDGIELKENQPACLYYSSGTTAEPKGVLYSHRNMISNISSICRGFRFSYENETHLIMLPLGHTASTNYSLLPCAWVGGKIIMAESFWHIRNKVWKLIEEHRITYMETVPTVLYSILNIYRERLINDLSSMYFVGCGSAPLQQSVQVEFQERYGLKVGNLYGLSETGPTHIDDPRSEGWRPGTIGFPLDVNEARIAGENGETLEPGAIGEIVIKGDNVFVGYYRNDAIYKSVVQDGWFHTGDLGFVDKQGVFYFADRKKDLIIKGGINIVPGEVDEIIMKHPAVKECATIGVPDPMFGEEVKSFVVLKDGFLLIPNDIITHCGKYLQKNKIPRYVEIVGDIPKTHSGKLLRKKLREM